MAKTTITTQSKPLNVNDELAQFGLRIEVLPIDSIKPYSNNPKTHDDDALNASFDSFGFKDVIIVDSDMEIVAGHGRLKLAKRKGLERVPVLIATDLDKIKAKAYRLAHNRITELGGWDEPTLVVELEELHDLNYDMSWLSFENMADFTPTEEDQPRLDQKKPITCPECGHEFTN